MVSQGEVGSPDEGDYSGGGYAYRDGRSYFPGGWTE
jgi:hypothetical protein